MGSKEEQRRMIWGIKIFWKCRNADLYKHVKESAEELAWSLLRQRRGPDKEEEQQFEFIVPVTN